MGKIYLFTFCVDIQRHSKQYLWQVLNMLINSLEKYNNNYELHIFSNFLPSKLSNNKIIIHDYFDNNEHFFNNRGHNSKWLNLSWNKINIYKYLYDKYNINFLWIDIDTLVTSNIEYINDVSNFFIPHGGTESKHESIFVNDNTNKYVIPYNKQIQGNVWKIDINLYNKLIETFNELQQMSLQLKWDIQSLITYYIEFKLKGNINENNIYLSGINYREDTINGLCIHTSPNDDGWGILSPNSKDILLMSLKNMYYKNNILQSKNYLNKEIHFVGFTMYALNNIINEKIFKDLFN